MRLETQFAKLKIRGKRQNQEREKKEKIALLPIKGPIVFEQPFSLAFGMRMVASKETVRLLEQIKRSKRIKALVLEISCPGGTPLPCKEIAGAIKSIGKPTVAWIAPTKARKKVVPKEKDSTSQD